jgi:6-phospho-beta-glucosidase
VKIAILGGGGFRVPLVFGGLLERSDRLRIDEVVLHDVDPQRQRRIAAVLEGLRDERGIRLAFRSTESAEDAVDGADFVFCAIRVGGLEGRVIDEAVPLAERVVGQETAGPGGIAFALRTVPVMLDLAETVAARAPGAWFLNFTNPAGLVTEALHDVLGERVIGICDTPTSLCRRVAAALNRDETQLRFDYAGLNHVGWLMAVHDGPLDLLPALLADDGRLDTLLEGRLFGAERLRRLGMIPNEYLAFYDFAAETVATLRNGTEPRGSFLLHHQAAFYEAADRSPADALGAWRRALDDRDRTYLAEALAATGARAAPTAADAGGYERVALDVVEAIALDRPAVLILDTANGTSLPFLDERAVVEVPCRVDASGVAPLAPGQLPAEARRLLGTLKHVERLTIRAALERSRTLAVEALALHPLVPSGDVAERILDAYAGQNPALAWAGVAS